jgi:CBS domain containing-hemolysin-like protein
MTTWALIAAVALLVANAFFVAVEFALLAARRSVIEPLAETSRRARTALAAMNDLNRQMSAAQLGITMASLGLGFVAEPAVAHLLEGAIESATAWPSSVRHAVSFAVALSIVAFFHMVLGEMVPKNVALAGAERVAMLLAPMHARFVALLAPVIWALNGMSTGVVRLFGIEPTDELASAHTPAEFLSMVDASRGEGLIGDFSHGLLSGALELRSRPISSVMVPWAEVVWVPRLMPVSEIEKVVVSSGHSRLPMVRQADGGLEGYLHAKDLLRVPASVRHNPLPTRRIHAMVVLSPERTLSEALLAMRRQRSHVALVRDGETSLGLVSLEDIVEQVVGDIRDEADIRVNGT